MHRQIRFISADSLCSRRHIFTRLSPVNIQKSPDITHLYMILNADKRVTHEQIRKCVENRLSTDTFVGKRMSQYPAGQGWNLNLNLSLNLSLNVMSSRFC